MSLSSCASCEAFVPLRFSTCPSCGAEQPLAKRIAVKAAMAVAGAGFVTTLMACYGGAVPPYGDSGPTLRETPAPAAAPGDPTRQ